MQEIGLWLGAMLVYIGAWVLWVLRDIRDILKSIKEQLER